MKKQKSISQQLQEVISEHEKELRENYEKMLAGFERLRKKLAVGKGESA